MFLHQQNKIFHNFNTVMLSGLRLPEKQPQKEQSNQRLHKKFTQNCLSVGFKPTVFGFLFSH